MTGSRELVHPVTPEELMAYLDGELGHAEAASVHAHVVSCASCARLSGDLAALSPALRTWSVEPAPSALVAPPLHQGWSRLRKAIWPFRTKRVAVWQMSAAVGSLVVIAVLGLTFAGRPDSDLSMPQPSAAVSISMDSAPVEVAERRPAQSGMRRAEGRPEVRVGGNAVAARSIVEAPQAGPPGLADRRIVRTATISIATRELEQARTSIERLLRELGGFVGNVNVGGASEESRVMHATLRVPAARLDAAMASVRQLGHVLEESQNGDDVTERARDISARLSNARATEKRLLNLLGTRTGNLEHVLAAEREVARVREDIERLEAQRQGLDQQVAYATLSVRITEQRQAALIVGPSPLSWQVRAAFMDGSRAALDSALSVALFLIRVLPSLLLWAALLGVPAVLIGRRLRKAAG